MSQQSQHCLQTHTISKNTPRVQHEQRLALSQTQTHAHACWHELAARPEGNDRAKRSCTAAHASAANPRSCPADTRTRPNAGPNAGPSTGTTTATTQHTMTAADAHGDCCTERKHAPQQCHPTHRANAIIHTGIMPPRHPTPVQQRRTTTAPAPLLPNAPNVPQKITGNAQIASSPSLSVRNYVRRLANPMKT